MEWRLMRVHEFRSEVWLPRSRDEIFTFFSDASNLDVITPPWLHFRTTTPAPIETRSGALIDYEIRLRGFPIRWRTKITVWEPPTRFVDQQIRGPYRKWIHEHTFEERDGGTLVRDRVQYAVPFDFLVHRWLVRPDIQRIFTYRTAKLREYFGRQRAHQK